MWFDTHCHLYDVGDPDSLSDVVARAVEARVSGMVVLGVDVETSRRSWDISRRYENVWAGAAFHPTSTKGWSEDWSEPLEQLLGEADVVAVGETGLDHHWDTSFNEDQAAAFIHHIRLAKSYDKALVIHTRSSVAAALEILESVGAPERLVFHCWSGSMDELGRALELGSYISFAGNVSFKKAEDLRHAARSVPEERLLVETDSPYLSPEPKRGKPNEPANVALVGAAVATARSVPPEDLAALTTRNAHNFFAIQ